jgi:glycosyltransferase involved in cell wall biosynthesis
MKRIAVLLNGSVYNDSRVIRIINSLSTIAFVDLFYVGGSQKDEAIFGDRVQLFSVPKRFSWRLTLIRNSFFYNEFLFFIDMVKETGVKYDYIYANDLPCLKPALKIKKFQGGQIVYDSHEIFVETLNQFFPDNVSFVKSLRNGIALTVMKFLGANAEKRMLKEADFFITTNHSFRAYFEQKYGLVSASVVMNCPPLSIETAKIDLHEKLGLQKNDFLAIFQGVMNKGRALQVLLDAFKLVPTEIKLVMVGDGVLKKGLQAFVRKNNLGSQVFFIDKVPSAELLKYTRAADIGINLQQPINLSKELASANKLFEYIHAGIPVIGSNVPENIKIIETYNVGFIVENDARSLSKLLTSLPKMDQSVMKQNCQKASYFFNWQKQEEILLKIFE